MAEGKRWKPWHRHVFEGFGALDPEEISDFNRAAVWANDIAIVVIPVHVHGWAMDKLETAISSWEKKPGGIATMQCGAMVVAKHHLQEQTDAHAASQGDNTSQGADKPISGPSGMVMCSG